MAGLPDRQLGLAAEGAARGQMDDAEFLRGHAQDHGQLVPVGKGALVGGVDSQFVVLVVGGERAVHLDPGVLLRLGGKVGLHNDVALGKALLHIAPPQRRLLADVALLARHVGVPVGAVLWAGDQGGAGLQRVLDGEDRGQHLVVHPDGLRALVGGLLGVGEDHRHRVADVLHPLVAEDGLVLGQDAVDVLAGDVPGGDDNLDPGHPVGGVGVHIEHPGVGVGAVDRLAVHHAGEVVIGVELGPAGQLIRHVPPGDGLADKAAGLGEVQWVVAGGLIPPEDGGGLLHRRDDPGIGAAAAQVQPQGFFDLRLRGVWILIQQPVGGHEQPRSAKAALNGVIFHISLLHGVQPAVFAQPLHGHHVPALQILEGCRAGADRLAVYEHGAGAAGLFLAAAFCAGQFQILPQEVQQQAGAFFVRAADAVSVHLKLDHKSCSFLNAAVCGICRCRARIQWGRGGSIAKPGVGSALDSRGALGGVLTQDGRLLRRLRAA